MDELKTASKPPRENDLEEWSDVSGRYKLRARYVSSDDSKVRLHREDGQMIEIEIEQLSQESRARVKELMEQANPFRVLSP